MWLERLGMELLYISQTAYRYETPFVPPILRSHRTTFTLRGVILIPLCRHSPPSQTGVIQPQDQLGLVNDKIFHLSNIQEQLWGICCLIPL